MEQLFYLPSTMLWPLAACLVLTGIHVYLGVHVIARKVIFVDLALAQIAALGTVVGVLLGYEVGKDATQLYLYSLTFTIFGAFIFSVTRMRGERVPHEAIIGIVYAVTFAATMLVLSRSALGPQELDHIIKGELLWVQPHVVIKTAAIYALVGVFHFVFRRKFMAISFDAVRAEREGLNVRLWDFLFYMSFGFVITSSVAIAGVFLVFSYLVIPSVGAMLLSEKLSTRLTIGWVAGSIISFIGVKLSWTTGLPTSPLIVVVLALALILSGIVHFVRHSDRPWKAVLTTAALAGVAAAFLAGVFLFRKADEDPLEHTLHMLRSPLSTDRLTALTNLGSFSEKKDQWLASVEEKVHDDDAAVRMTAVKLLSQLHERGSVPAVVPLLDDRSDEVRASAIDAIRQLGDRADGLKMLERLKIEEDEEMKVRLLSAALDLGCPEAFGPLAIIIRDGGIFADDALAAVQQHLPHTVTSYRTPDLLRWLAESKDRLSWDPSMHSYEIRKQK